MNGWRNSGGRSKVYRSLATALIWRLLPLNARFAPAIEQPVVIAGGGSTTLLRDDVIAAGLGAAGTSRQPIFRRTNWKAGRLCRSDRRHGCG